MAKFSWHGIAALRSRKYVCWCCYSIVATREGYAVENTELTYILICPHCSRPTYFEGNNQVPAPPFGAPVKHLPPDIKAIYEEARRCTSAGSYTAVFMLCRKLLMNIAVQRGAKAGGTFHAYVEYLEENRCVPPDCSDWVKDIREKGNEANHEIKVKEQSEAEDVLGFVEMLLKFICEWPGKKQVESKSP